MSVAAIILAAGASRRLGQPKQLLLYRGETLLSRAIRLALEAGASPVFAVIGANSETVKASIPSAAVAVVNNQWEQGIASSIHAGLHELNGTVPGISGALLMGCDQPRLSACHLHLQLDTFNAREQPAIVASTYAGVNGIPAVFPRAAFPDLLALRGDRGARALIAKPPCPVVFVALEGGEIDIDLPKDVAELE
ncbi:MAG TPA: nucleotidyltransferase family protein [Terracidiphilus sp.]|jgi:CTP:molybdopterin cytidylyltransferase MocA